MMSLAVLAAYLATGAVAGFFAGLLGVGGGVIVVPVLAMLFAGQGFPAGEVLHLALGTAMAAILFTAASSLRAHHAHRAVLWPVVRRLTRLPDWAHVARRLELFDRLDRARAARCGCSTS